MTTDPNILHFLSELTDLTKRTGVYICSCSCCCNMDILKLSDEQIKNHEYRGEPTEDGEISFCQWRKGLGAEEPSLAFDPSAASMSLEIDRRFPKKDKK